MAQKFNNFFISIASSLVNKLSWGLVNLDMTILCLSIRDRESNAFHFKETSVDHVYKILNSLRASKAIDLDDLSARFIKDDAKSIAPLITHVVNMSIAHGKVPDDIKSA